LPGYELGASRWTPRHVLSTERLNIVGKKEGKKIKRIAKSKKKKKEKHPQLIKRREARNDA